MSENLFKKFPLKSRGKKPFLLHLLLLLVLVIGNENVFGNDSNTFVAIIGEILSDRSEVKYKYAHDRLAKQRQ